MTSVIETIALLSKLEVLPHDWSDILSGTQLLALVASTLTGSHNVQLIFIIQDNENIFIASFAKYIEPQTFH